MTGKKNKVAGPGGLASRLDYVFKFEEGVVERVPFDEVIRQRDRMLLEQQHTVLEHQETKQEQTRAVNAKMRKIARAPRPGRRHENSEDIAREFKRLVREGHTESQARSILNARGLASKSTIYRNTTAPKKKSVR